MSNKPSDIHQPLISVIIPIRVTSFRKDIFDRLSFCHRQEASTIEYIVVDDGSLENDANELKQKCTELGYRYVSTGVSITKRFNLARARNKGAVQAQGKYVLFLDVDLLTYPGFYGDVATEIELQNLAHNSDVFLMFPVIYLNEKGKQIYDKQSDSLKKHLASQIMIEGKNQFIEKYSYGTSCILVDRVYYLTIGGQNEDFEGWGYEDYDFTIKMLRLSSRFEVPSDYSSMKGNFMTITRYEGWKAQYRLYGMWMARKGIYLYHVPHEVDTHYKGNEAQNLELLQKSLSQEIQHHNLQTIEPKYEHSLLLSKNPFCCDYKLNPLLGHYKILNIKEITHWTEIKEYFFNHGFTQVVFPNPYGNPLLLAFYQYCRDEHIKYIISERGALPGSIYHDDSGFLFDSSSYDPNKWDMPLSDEQYASIQDYLKTLKKGSETLEEQPEKLETELILGRLAINGASDKMSKKKVLIILQTKNDTVIKFFGRGFTTQQALKNFIETLIEKSAGQYDFIYKNHPLEPSPMQIDGAINADNYHINDLIDICDGVLTVNSGAGLIAALLQKPVFTLGDSWYTKTGIACDVTDEDDFLTKLDSFNPNEEKLIRFAYYLRYNFYSFGKQHTIIHKKENSIINATLSIDYTEVQTANHGRIYYRDKDDRIGFDSILFKEYEKDSLLIDGNVKAKQSKKIANKKQKYRKKMRKIIKRSKSFLKDSAAD